MSSRPGPVSQPGGHAGSGVTGCGACWGLPPAAGWQGRQPGAPVLSLGSGSLTGRKSRRRREGCGSGAGRRGVAAMTGGGSALFNVIKEPELGAAPERRSSPAGEGRAGAQCCHPLVFPESCVSSCRARRGRERQEQRRAPRRAGLGWRKRMVLMLLGRGGAVREAPLGVVPRLRRSMRRPRSQKLARGEKQQAQQRLDGPRGEDGGHGGSVGGGRLEREVTLGRGPSDGAESGVARGVQDDATTAASSSRRPGCFPSSSHAPASLPGFEGRRLKGREGRWRSQSWKGDHGTGFTPRAPAPALSPRLLPGDGPPSESP